MSGSISAIAFASFSIVAGENGRILVIMKQVRDYLMMCAPSGNAGRLVIGQRIAK